MLKHKYKYDLDSIFYECCSVPAFLRVCGSVSFSVVLLSAHITAAPWGSSWAGLDDARVWPF